MKRFISLNAFPTTSCRSVLYGTDTIRYCKGTGIFHELCNTKFEVFFQEITVMLNGEKKREEN